MRKTIIIKYTPNDNIAFTGQEEGWVDNFAQLLEAALTKFSISELDIRYKKEIEEIGLEDFTTADAVLYILSPAFIFSSNVTQEISELERLLEFDVATISKKCLKVIKAPIDENDLPMSLKVGNDYRFFHYTDEQHQGYETFEGWNEYKENLPFWQIFTDLIFDIHGLFQGSSKVDSFKKVYLAPEFGSRYKEPRESLKRELKSHGLSILPDEEYAIEAAYLADVQGFYLEKAQLAIHFPEEFMPIEHQENKDKLDKFPKLKRLIWFDPEKLNDVNKAKGYSDLKINLKSFNNIEAIEAPLEELKDIIKERFGLGFKANARKDNQGNKKFSHLVYVIASGKNLGDDYQVLVNRIKELGWEVAESIHTSENASEQRRKHYDNLQQADYFILYAVNGALKWIEANAKEVKKAPGMLRKKSILGKFIITDNKESLPSAWEEDFTFLAVDEAAEANFLSKPMDNEPSK
ncbi:hypothetical protein QWY31_16085 [Cytophagales bacterium LB-30]|uniref:TIR domain-containing protein n=1 Tax=Shiella aurantiaca TaxID=3058365 RepID=A0ABT8FAM8_9BACT|nr:hypothetical protein [Shiella aurantiaca]MDN4167031.1 hypothetical protein [Shiella aurantiaca]